MRLDDGQKRILDMICALAGERDFQKTLEDTLAFTMEAANCDSGTVYLAHSGSLRYVLMRTDSLSIYRGEGGEVLDMPAVDISGKSICGYCAENREKVNIPDIYESDEFDFTGPKKYDGITGYRTSSMLVVPITDHDEELIGVLQLINAQDEDNNMIPFDEDAEVLVNTLVTQAGAILANIRHHMELEGLFDSTIKAVTAAIDERTPYSTHHTSNVAEHCRGFVDYLNDQHDKGACRYSFDENAKEQLIMAARFHDIGKLTVSLDVMNKAGRLSPETIKEVKERFSYVELLLELSCERREITEDDYAGQLSGLKYALDVIMEANAMAYLPDNVLDRVRRVAKYTYTDHDGNPRSILSPEEVDLLSIRKGTLSGEERKAMEAHVSVTSRILDSIEFHDRYNRVRSIAGSHHEFLDGSGYPQGLKGSSIPVEVRILTIADIFDSLRAADRPYKKSMSLHKALGVLREMVDEGKLDGGLVELFCDYADPDRRDEEV